MTPVTVITGASAGIGAELARVFAANGHALVLVARREQRLRALAAEIAAAGHAMPLVLPIDLCADATSPPDWAVRSQATAWSRSISSTTRATGWSAAPPSLDLADQLAMIDVNVRALTDLSLAFVDSLARRRGGVAQRGVGGGLSAGTAVRRSTMPARPSCSRSARHCIAS